MAEQKRQDGTEVIRTIRFNDTDLNRRRTIPDRAPASTIRIARQIDEAGAPVRQHRESRRRAQRERANVSTRFRGNIVAQVRRRSTMRMAEVFVTYAEPIDDGAGSIARGQ